MEYQSEEAEGWKNEHLPANMAMLVMIAASAGHSAFAGTVREDHDAIVFSFLATLARAQTFTPDSSRPSDNHIG